MRRGLFIAGGLLGGLVAGALLSTSFGAVAGTAVGNGGSVVVSGAGTCDPTNNSCPVVTSTHFVTDGGVTFGAGFNLGSSSATSSIDVLNGNFICDLGFIQASTGLVAATGNVTASAGGVSASTFVTAGTTISAGSTITATSTIKGLHFLGGTALSAGNVTGTAGLTAPSIVGTDVEGIISFTGAANSYGAGATLFTLTFGSGFSTPPSVSISPANAATAALFPGSVFGVSSSGNFVATAGLAATTTTIPYKFQYLVLGQ